MYCIILGHEYINEIQTITQVFYPNEKFILCEAVSQTGITAVSRLGNTGFYAAIYLDGKLQNENYVPVENSLNQKDIKRLAKLSMYNSLRAVTGYTPPWGMLTGIRPSKIAGSLISDGYTPHKAALFFKQYYMTSPDKIKLAIDVAEAELEIIKNSRKNSICLYISIPFCPSRCRYCSFISYPMKRYAKSINDYLLALVKEMGFISDCIKNAGTDMHIESIYIGGGTPTSLDNEQLAFLLENTSRLFNLAEVREYTVEAGRPDTITEKKLDILKRNHVSRISINPQTMNDETLLKIGRGHNSEDVEKAFYLAREKGFGNINMDIIIGLEGERAVHVENTMNRLSALHPDSVTVHILSVKRSSDLNRELIEKPENLILMESGDMEYMLKTTSEGCRNMNMNPYYMYRQKNMIGNYENVGYSVKGAEGIYNVQMMVEKQTVLAAGAGAVTKLVNGDRIDRIFNVKNVEEYISRIDEMIKRKEVLAHVDAMPKGD